MKEKRLYHFVKFTKDGIWYLKPECLEDVIEHFEKFFGQEIKDGCHDYIQGTKLCKHSDGTPWIYHEHPITDWNSAVTAINEIYSESWWVTATKLENEVLNNRIKYFNRGLKCFYPEGLACYDNEDDDGTYYDECWKEELVYPSDEKLTFKDVRFMQWNMFGNKGEHWYAKVGKLDVFDVDGNLKWNTKEEAEFAARWFLKNKVNKRNE